MKKAILAVPVSMLFLLSSCWPVYRQQFDKGEPTNTDLVVVGDCYMDISLHQRYFKDGADYYVQLYLVPHEDLQFNVGDIKVSLDAVSAGKPYVLRRIYHFRREVIDGIMKKWTIDNTPTVDSSQTLHLSPGNYYYLVYAFSGAHHRKMKLNVRFDIHGVSDKKSVVFKKHIEVQLLH
jgi:hypothetical protein